LFFYLKQNCLRFTFSQTQCQSAFAATLAFCYRFYMTTFLNVLFLHEKISGAINEVVIDKFT